MAEPLFTNAELVVFRQLDELDTDVIELVRSLVTTEIRRYVGPAIFDAMSDADRAEFKGIALVAAKRATINPEGVRQRASQIDDFSESETFSTETLADFELTDSEKARIDAALGRDGAAFSIRPYGRPDCRPAYHRTNLL